MPGSRMSKWGFLGLHDRQYLSFAVKGKVPAVPAQGVFLEQQICKVSLIDLGFFGVVYQAQASQSQIYETNGCIPAKCGFLKLKLIKVIL